MIALCVIALSGCSFEGPWLQVWWGDLASESEPATFEAGEAATSAGLVFDQPVGDETATIIVLLGSWAPGSCDIHVDYMREVETVRNSVTTDDMNADGAAWICEQLAGLAREAYGELGDHRAVHALVGPGAPAGAQLRPAGDDLTLDETGLLDLTSIPQAGTYVARVLEWGSPQLPNAEDEPAGRCTAAVLGAWAEDGAIPADGVTAGAFRRYEHRHTGDPTVARASGDPSPVGFATEGWGTDDVTVAATVFTDAPAIPGSEFAQMVVGTEGTPIPLEACPAAAATYYWAFPEFIAEPVR
jgi:hypothetical protein